MSEDLEKIKERIAKLLAMAQDSSSPEEAAIAAGRARKLMDKYQVEAWECSKNIEEPMAEKRASRTYAAIPVFMGTLAVAVARFNDCQVRRVSDIVDYKMDSKRNQNNGRAPKRWGSYIKFFGYESDVQMACEMFDKLIDAMNNQCKAYLLPFGYAKYPVKIGTAWKSYFAQAVIHRLEAMTKERDELTMTSSSTALVIIKTKAVEDHFGEIKYGFTRYRSDLSDTDVGDAARAGSRAGKRQMILEEVKHDADA